MWRSGDDVRGVVMGEGEPHPFAIRGAEADLVAVGAHPGGATVLWNRGDDVWAAGVRRASPAGTATHVLSLAGRPARLDVVDAATPIVWARLFDALDDGPAAGDAGDGGSVVGAPGLGVLGVSGTLHEVLSWEDRVVLVGSTEIVWLEPLAGGVRRGG